MATPDQTRVLVVEDTKDVQFLMKAMLLRKGFEADIANDGQEAIEMTLSDEYDLILMDVQMPRMDGITATRKLRERGFKNPIIAVTAYVEEESKRQCQMVGCSDFVAKPLNSSKLFETIQKHLH